MYKWRSWPAKYKYITFTVNSFSFCNRVTDHAHTPHQWDRTWRLSPRPAIFLTTHTVMADPVETDQAERRDISYVLDVEQLDLNLYRSRNLTLPFQARGLFGGQVISQALVAATRCVESDFTLHVRVHSHACDICSGSTLIHVSLIMHPDSRCTYVSFLCLPVRRCQYKQNESNGTVSQAYFTLNASASVPLLYYVERLRDGRSHSTRSVRAVQGGRIVFVMLCSFHIPDFSQPSRHWVMPKAPPPDECEDEVERASRIAAQPDITEEHRSRLVVFIKVGAMLSRRFEATGH